MLWPHDKKARALAIHSATVQFLRENGDWTRVDLGFDWFGFAAEAMPIGAVSEAAKTRYVHGLIAGFVLHETLGRLAMGRKDASLSSCIAAAATVFGTAAVFRTGRQGVGKSTLLLQLAIAIVATREWIGTLPESGAVVFLSAR